MENERRFLTPWMGLLMAGCALCLGVFACLLGASLFGLYCVWYLAYPLSGSVGVALLLLIVCLWVRHRRPDWTRLRAVSVLLVALMIVSLALGLAVYGLHRIFNDGARVYTSPQGKNRLVVIEDGFLDATLHAYPMVGPWMYREVDNGFLSYHEVAKAWEVVTWDDEHTASVRMQSMGSYPNERSNSGGTIVVRFR